MRLVLHSEIPEGEDLRRRWNLLACRMPHPEVFYTYEWAAALCRSYGNDIVPLLALAYDDEILVGVFAGRRIRKGTQATFLGADTADYCDFVCQPDHCPEFLSLLFRELKLLGLHDVTLANLPSDSPAVAALKGSAHEHGYSAFLRPAYRCAQVGLSAGERPAVKSLVARKKVLHRDLKAMSKLGTVELLHLRTREDISLALPAFKLAHVERFRRQGKLSPLAHEARSAFTSELARLLAPQGWMTLSCLTLAGTPVAWNYGFEFGGSWFWYQPTFEESVAKYSPGSGLLAKIILDACDRNEIHRIDLGLGDEVYKERFATSYRYTLHATVTASPARYLKEKMRYRAASAIKNSPRAEHLVRKAIANWHPGSSA